MTKKRLAKFLAEAGIASRRKCEVVIAEGRVKVNGDVAILPQTLVDGSETITVDGKRIEAEKKKVYYLLNKPKGYYCSPLPKRKCKLVLDLFGHANARLFTVGRLDRDTTGLLIVTNDGDFAHRVIHPSSNIQKEYVAKTGHEITDTHLKTIAAGTVVEGTFVKPVKVQKVRKGTVRVVVSEGKKREVRHLMQAAGLDVLELKRVRIGGLHLGSLPIGCWREMREKEKEQIFKG